MESRPVSGFDSRDIEGRRAGLSQRRFCGSSGASDLCSSREKYRPQSERILSKDLTARAFDEAEKELGLMDVAFNGDTLMAVCNAGSCNAIKGYYFSVPKSETDRIRKVVVQFRNNQYELTMEKYSPPNRAN